MTSERPPDKTSPNFLATILTGLGYLLALPLFFLAVKIVQEYERGVIFRLGRLVGARGPGLFLILPIVERMVKVDLRVVTMDVPRQDVITKDNVTVKVDAVVYFRVVNPGGRRREDHGLHSGDVSGGADHAAKRPRSVGPG